MSVTNKIISCIGCNQSYDYAKHQPQVLDCGHGTCKTCVDQMKAQAVATSATPVCQQCHHVVQIPIPNFDLLDQISRHSASFSESVVKTTKQYQDLAKSLDDEISKVDSQLGDLKSDLVALLASEITDESKDLVLKAQELVTLGVFDDIEQAKIALSAKVKTTPRTVIRPTEAKHSYKVQVTQAMDQLKDLVNSRSTCLRELKRLQRKYMMTYEKFQTTFDERNQLIPGLESIRNEASERFKTLADDVLAAREKLNKIESMYADLIKKYFDIDGVVEDACSGRISDKKVVKAIAIAGTAVEDEETEEERGYVKFHALPHFMKRVLDEQCFQAQTMSEDEAKAAYANKLQRNFARKWIFDRHLRPGSSGISIITDSIYSCGICIDSYTAVGAHKPLVLSCGHGSCVSCVDNMRKHAMESCHLCRKPVNSTVVNKDLIGQMEHDTKELSERFKPHQYVIEFKKKYLCESEKKLSEILTKKRRLDRDKEVASSRCNSSSSTSSTSSIDAIAASTMSHSSSSSSSTSSTSPFQGFVDTMVGMRDSFSNWWNQTVGSNQPQSHTTTTASTTYLPSSAQTAPQRQPAEDDSDED